MVSVCGGGGRSLVLGFMIASAGLSMWISNTATTLMMLPLIIAVLEKAEDKKLKIPLLLGVACSKCWRNRNPNRNTPQYGYDRLL